MCPAFGIVQGNVCEGGEDMEKASAEESSRKRVGWEWQSCPGHMERGKRRAWMLSGRRVGCSVFRLESVVEQESQDGVTCKAELQGWAGLDTSSPKTYGFIPGFPDSSRNPGVSSLKELICSLSDAAHEVTLQGDNLVHLIKL